eukprot:g12222.t1
MEGTSKSFSIPKGADYFDIRCPACLYRLDDGHSRTCPNIVGGEEAELLGDDWPNIKAHPSCKSQPLDSSSTTLGLQS